MNRFFPLVLLVSLAVTGGCSKSPEASLAEHLKRGKAYSDQKKFAEAAIEFEGALQADPRSGEAFLGLGDAKMQLGDKKRALQAYVRAADQLPGRVDVMLKAGSMRLFARQYEDARAMADAVLAKEPRNLTALVLRANALAGLNDVPTAIKEITEAIKMDPTRGELYSNLGSLQANTGKNQLAEEAFKQAVAVDPQSPQTYSALGNFYWSIGRRADAEQAFVKAVSLDRNDLLANRILAVFYMASKRQAEAEPYLRAVADLSGDVQDRFGLADYYLLNLKKELGIAILNDLAKQADLFGQAKTRLAAFAYAEGRSAEGHEILAEVIKRNPIDARALLLSAKFELLDKKPEAAMQQALAAVTADPTYAEARYFLGRLYQERGSAKEATNEFTTVLQLNTRAAAAQYELSRLNLGAGRTEAAVTYADAAVQNANAELGPRLALIRALLGRRDFKRAEAELAPLRRVLPDAEPVLTMTGNFFVLKGDYAAARQYFETALKKDPNSLDAISGLLAVDFANKNPAAAKARIEAEVAKAPQRTGLRLLASRTYAAAGDLVKAEESLKSTIAIDPTSADAYSMLGQFYYQQNRLDDGRQEFERMLSQQPNSIQALTMLGIILNKQGRTDESIRRYEEALAIDPRAGIAANNLAWLYVQSGRNLDRALALAHAAKNELPDAADVADTLGWIYYIRGFPNLALPFLEEAAVRDPESAQIQFHLGAAYFKVSDQKKAKLALERALKLSDQFEGIEEAKKMLATLK